MSRTIDERVVEMKFDNSSFESGAKTTMSTLDKLKQALKFDKVGEGFDNISKAAGNVKLDSIGTACETVSAKFSAMQVMAYTALSKITSDAIDAGKNIANALTLQGAKDGFTEYELKMGSVQTIMNSTGEDLKTVMNYLEELNKYADQTIYSFSDMTSNIGKFTNSGVKLEDAVAAIKGVSNEAAVSGANAQEASRAMYNFAQALSAGYVKLIDWKSIENANMATVEFKNELIKTALELGTVVKEEDKYRSTTTDAKGKTSDLFDATHAFNEALSSQWMTTEVLTKTLAKYADENTELGKKAYAAAQDVKTFSMMVDTLKEAVGSGWAVTWEKFIGDFEQAKKFFTGMTNTLSDIISAQADARNKLVDDVMNKGEGLKNVNDWTKLAETIRFAGGDVGQFRDLLVDTARENGVAIDEMIAKAGNFNDTLEQGWLSSDILDKALIKAESLGNLSPEYAALAKSVSLVNKPFRTFLDELTETSGRTHVINILKNTFEALRKVIAPIKDAFKEIFPPKTADDIRNILKAIDEFTKKLILSDDAAAALKETLRGFFNLIKQSIDVVKSVANAFSPLIDIFKIIFVNILDGIHGLGLFFNTLGEGESEVSLFQTVLNAIHDTLQSFADNLQSYIDKAKTAILALKDAISQSWDTGALSIVASLVEKIKDVLSGFTTGLSNGLQHFFDVLSGASVNGSGIKKVFSILDSFANGIKTVCGIIFKYLEPLIDKFKTFFSELNIIDSLAMAIEAGGIAGVVAFLGRMVDNISDLIGGLKNFTKAVTENNPVVILEGFITGIADCLGGIEDKFRSDVITNFAISIGILAASIYVLSTIDGKGAKQAIAIVTAVLGELVGVFLLINKLSSSYADLKFVDILKKSFANIAQAKSLGMIATSIIKLAAAVLILAVAMKIIAGIDTVSLLLSFAVVSALLWELVGVCKVLESNEKKMISGAGAMTKLAVSVLILSAALKIIASIDSDKLLDSFLVLSAILLELTIFMQVLSGNKGTKGAGTLIALAVAITILAASMKIFASMDWESLTKGLFSIGALLIELGVAMKFMQSNIGAAASLLIASVAIIALAAALKILSTIPSDTILPILGLLGGVLLELALGLTAMVAALPGAAALIIASAAVLVLAGALKVMATIPSDNILSILGLLGGVLAELAIGLNLMVAALPGAAALLVAAAAIAVLVPALIALSAVPAKKIWTSIGQLAVALLAFGAVSAVLGVVSPLILAFGAAVTVLGVGIALAGAGLLAFAVALGLVCEVGSEASVILADALEVIITKLLTFAPRIAVAVGESIVKVLETIGTLLPKVQEVLIKLLDMVISLISTYVPQLVTLVADLLLNILETARTYIPEYVNLVLELITGVIEAVAQNLPNLIQAGADLIVGFLQGIQDNIGRVIDEAYQTVVAFINGLADAVRNNSKDIFDAAMNLISAFIDAIINCIASLGAELLGGGMDIINKIWSGFSSLIGDVITGVSNFVMDIINTICEYADDFYDAGKELISELWNGFLDKIDILNLRDMGDKLGGELNGVFKQAILGAGGSADEFNKIYKEQGILAATAYVDGLKSQAGFDIHSPSKKTREIGVYAMEGLSKGLEDGEDGVRKKGISYIQSLLSDMTEAASSKSKDFNSVGAGAMSNIGSAISSSMSSVTNPFSTTFDNVLKTIKEKKTLIVDETKNITKAINETILTSEPSITNQVQALMLKIFEAIHEKSKSIKTLVKNTIQDCVSNIKAEYNDFYSAGEYIVDGFIKGIKSKIALAAQAASEMAQAATKAAQKKLDEHSPSKVFAQIGEYVGEGFIKGIADYDDKSANAGMSLVMNAIKSANDALENGMDTAPVIKPVLDLSDIEANAGKINDITGNIDNLSIGMTNDLALRASSSFNTTKALTMAQNQNQMDILRSAINALSNDKVGTTQNNTFNISGDNPREIANEVSRILQMQVERRGAVWA